MKRMVQPEWLDELPPTDPAAQHSRRDLRRINRMMRNPTMAAEILSQFAKDKKISYLTELGAGDGAFALEVVRKLPRLATEPEITLLDIQNSATPETLSQFKQVHWRAKVVTADVFKWPEMPTQVVLANLFLHHFENGRLQQLLAIIAQRAEWFIAIEPRRGWWPLLNSRLLWALGCNAVTQHDAVISVRAGFAGQELSELWPEKRGWELREYFGPPFSHIFVARRKLP